MEIYIKLFEVLFPVFFIVGIGYYLGKKDKKFDTTFITNFAANVGTPAMVIYAITSTGISFELFKNYFFLLCCRQKKHLFCNCFISSRYSSAG